MKSFRSQEVDSDFVAPARAASVLVEGFKIMSVYSSAAYSSEKAVASVCAIDLRWGDSVEMKGQRFMVSSVSRSKEGGWFGPDIHIEFVGEDDAHTYHGLISDVFDVVKFFRR